MTWLRLLFRHGLPTIKAAKLGEYVAPNAKTPEKPLIS
jgi:hypothetical protein